MYPEQKSVFGTEAGRSRGQACRILASVWRAPKCRALQVAFGPSLLVICLSQRLKGGVTMRKGAEEGLETMRRIVPAECGSSRRPAVP
ncbi:hypothetical protein V8C35DRAFT_310554 [Trichoderma chlorosporum]